MPNEQACDGSRPACDAAMAQLAAVQGRADAANEALLDTIADLSRYQAQSAEFERVYERELKRAESAEKERDEWRDRWNAGLAVHFAAEKMRADALAQQVVKHEVLLRRVLACALVGHEADALRQDIQQALVRSHIGREAAEKEARQETGMPMSDHNFDVEEQLAAMSAEIETQRARADALAQQVVEAREALGAIAGPDLDSHLYLEKRNLLYFRFEDAELQVNEWHSRVAKHALVYLDTAKETTMLEPIPIHRDAEFAKMRAELEVEGKKTMNLGLPPEMVQLPPAVPAPPTPTTPPAPQQGPYGYDVSKSVSGSILQHLLTENGVSVAAFYTAETCQHIAAALNDVETYHGLLREVLVGRHIYTEVPGMFVVELDPDLHRRIRAAVEEGNDAI